MNGYGKVQYSGVTDAGIRGRQMDELIRKKDALDALMAERKHLLANGQKGAEHILTHHGYNVIAELDVPEINVGDIISKRAASTIPVMPKEHRHYQTNNLDDAYEQGWTDLQECIENLPPVQPRQTNCEYCHTDRDGYVFPLEKNSHAFIDRDKIVLKANGWRGEAKIKYCPICGRKLTDGTD